jgi:hypothetical protein
MPNQENLELTFSRGESIQPIKVAIKEINDHE